MSEDQLNAPDPPAPKPQPQQTTLLLRKKPLKILLLMGFWALAGILLLAELGSVFWFFELLTHFRLHYTILLTACVVALLLARHWKTGVFAAVLWLWQSSLILHLYWPSKAKPPFHQELRLVVANVYAGNPTPERLIRWLQKTRPDVALLLELTPSWSVQLQRLHTLYPHRIEDARRSNFGIGLYCRHKCQASLQQDPTSRIPFVRASLPWGDKLLHLWGIHPPPPISQRLASLRDRMMRRWADQIQQQRSQPHLVFGDLNMTSWSPVFARFLQQTGLHDSRQGFGLQATWHPWTPLHLAIDHVLVSPTIKVLQRAVGPDVGSDHRPVLIRISR